MIGGVTDSPAFADLVDLKRQFIALTEQQKILADAMPAPTAIVAGEAAPTDEQVAEWDRVRAELSYLAVRIDNHEAFDNTSQIEHYQLATEASKAARSNA